MSKETKNITEEKQDALKSLNIFEKISLACEKIGAVQKGAQVNVGRGYYQALTESDVLKAVNLAEKECRIKSYTKDIEILEQSQVRLDGSYTTWHFVRIKAIVEVVNLDNIQEKVQFVGLGDGWDVGDKASNKAQSYALKYALLKGYKIVGGDDGDYFASVDNLPNEDLIALVKSTITTTYDENKQKAVWERLFAKYQVGDVKELSRIQLIDACKLLNITL